MYDICKYVYTYMHMMYVCDSNYVCVCFYICNICRHFINTFKKTIDYQ